MLLYLDHFSSFRYGRRDEMCRMLLLYDVEDGSEVLQDNYVVA